MKKLILFLLLSLSTLAQTVTYTENAAIIANPERGMYYHTETHSTGYSLLNQTSLVNLRTVDKITLILRVFYLENYKNSTIPAGYLTNMQTDFTRARNAGIKVIVRFAYNDSSSQTDAPKAIVLQHIAQLLTVLNTNSDVILCVQQGFIGSWGEGYYTTNFGNNGVLTAQNIADRNEVLQAELDNFTSFLQVRTPLFKQRFTGSTTPVNAYDVSRIGHHNDSFLSSNSEQGTYSGNNANILLERAYVAQETQFTPMGGEGNEFPTAFTNNVLADMNTYNYTYFNSVGYASGLINDWDSKGWLTEIKNRLGYRFILDNSTFTVSGSSLSVTLNMRNTGFARMFREREVFLVLRDGATTILAHFTTDIRTWEGSFTLNQTFTVPDGNYEAFLYMPDSELSSPSYAVQLANNGLWEASTGYNRLNQNFVITSTCSATSTWNGTNWVGGLPSETRNVIINGNYNTEFNGSFNACNLTVNGNLTVAVGTFVTFQEHLEVVGNIVVSNGGTLIPVNTTSTSNGNVSIQRRTTLMKRFDYTYWGSPVATTIGQALGTWQNNYTFTFETPSFFDIDTVYSNGTPTVFGVADGQDDNDDAWIIVPETAVMQQGKGYASMIKSIPSTGSYPRTELVTFSGDLTTGVVDYHLQLSGNPIALNDDFNLISNPYSASINANDFINTNLANISGTLAFWTHEGTMSSTYSGLSMNNFSTQDYAYYNLLGGIASSFGGKLPTNAIGSCQGFMVESENTNNITFLPNMMSKVYSNTTDVTFFRSEEPKRAWISLFTEDRELYSQQLIGYSSNTSLEHESGWDNKIREAKFALKFYSLDGRDFKNDIQARGEFDYRDEVPLGYISAVEGKLTISLDSLSRIDKAFIKDYGVLKRLPYTFESEVGEFNKRFTLVYEWDRKPFEVVLVPNPSKHTLTVYFDNDSEDAVEVFDLQGQLLEVKQTVFLDKVIISTETLNNATYLVRVGGESYKFLKD
jgi:hypothetical protein